MSLVDRIVQGFKAQFLSKVVTAVASGILVAALARLLNPDGYGLLVLALTIFKTFQMIARLGIGGSAGRYVAEFKETDPEQIPHIVRFSFILALAAITVVMLGIVLSYQFIVEVLHEPDLAPFLLVGCVLLALGGIRSYLRKVLQGLEEIQFVAVMKSIEPASRLFFALGFVLAGFGALGAYVGYILSSAVTASLGIVYLGYRLREYSGDSGPVKDGLRRRIAEYAIPLTATSSAMVLDNRIDTLLVAYFLGPVEVGFYVLSGRVVQLIETPMSALGFTISPMFGSEKAAGNLERISRIYEMTLTNTLLLYIPAAAGLVLLAGPLIRLVFGADYSGAEIVLQALGPYVVFKSITKLTDNGLNYLGRARDRAIVRSATAVLNIGLNVLLIQMFGVVGAAIATVISYGIYTAANLYIVSLELELRPPYLLKQVGMITGITAVMSVFVYFLVTFVSGWITLFLVVGTGSLIWMVLSVATGLLELKKISSTLS